MLIRNRARSKCESRRRGAVIVEFALVAPVFLILITGIIELGRAIVVQQLLTNVSRDGARIAGYDSTTSTSTVTTAVDSYLANVGVSGATTTVSPNPPSLASDGQSVTVTVSGSPDDGSGMPPSTGRVVPGTRCSAIATTWTRVTIPVPPDRPVTTGMVPARAA